MSNKINSPVMLKNVAEALMEDLGISKPYILDYTCNNQVYLYENAEARRIDVGSELHAKIKELEQKHNGKIYAVTHDYLPIVGEMYSFLYVSPYQEDWDRILRPMGRRRFMVYAYVQNVEIDICSEFGYVLLESAFGELRRVG